ncbi:LSU ribosomal protein L23P [Methanosarcina thermophila]|jgi:large subunit ribosomal protein L23|uniref:Large ribosomal subunit protein uL23 n=3 Tax=Methanosarcina thermophila TaxID=2210 RepID=A0A1I6XPZ5_METTE|nr:50S ribosomal protein L23 [Methanosarcina thermophila]ALK05635.1 MAG: 50S ribosomal protein L23 [Methanosarcina sp. 795]AKB12921.1 LSU ribosomal protein L23Ae (L23p) [Methanosarcina thermophila TM-1]AKB16458.1 LSU ribosomal protein L23Ae (L23p) [Methanosarcina thermophila CHTI-55]NLU56950.1 50S ribosomal protein L23 [Methanosarcina thermophila]SFT40133.1 LSU ribosomal protein L23P [Methanosarcina thermophila]
MSSIFYPFVTEKAMMLLDQNKLQFIVDPRSNKKQIAEDVEKLYGFKVKSVRTMTTMKGTKKAILTFEDPESAHEIATRIGLM